MLIDGKPTTAIWPDPDGEGVFILDQTRLPHVVATVLLRDLEDLARAIKDMLVRGAPLIGVTAAFGLALALRKDASDAEVGAMRGGSARRTADRRQPRLGARTHGGVSVAARLCAPGALSPRPRSRKGCRLQCGDRRARPGSDRRHATRDGRTVRILTHCNAGWLATVDWGTATAPIYRRMPPALTLHVWVDETRPRNQGAALTAWELGQQASRTPDRRQRRRPSDAARRDRSGHRRQPTASPPTATSATRSAPI